MVWQETGIMDARNAFIDEWLEDRLTVTELCEQFGISRKTGHKWLRRYDDLGRSGGRDRGADRGEEGGEPDVGCQEDHRAA
jgi:putative transposase